MESYQIRTLKDIFELPTYEQMETCLDEISQAMKVARVTGDMMEGVAEKMGIGSTGMVWPDTVEWKDDNKGEVDLEVIDLSQQKILSVNVGKQQAREEEV